MTLKLFSKEEIQAKRQIQTRELIVKNDKLISSLKRALALQNDIDFDADKAKKVKDYQTWCDDLQKKQSKELESLKAYQKLVEDIKEDYYMRLSYRDGLEDRIMNLKEEIEKLDLQIKWKQGIINGQ